MEMKEREFSAKQTLFKKKYFGCVKIVKRISRKYCRYEMYTRNMYNDLIMSF